MVFSTFVAQKTVAVIDTIGTNLFGRFSADITFNFRHVVANQQFDFGASRQFAGNHFPCESNVKFSGGAEIILMDSNRSQGL